MSERVRLLAQLVKRGAGLSDVVAAAYRGIVILGDASAISRFAGRSEELTLKVFGARQHYALYLDTGDELSRELAVALTDDLMVTAGAALKGDDLRAVGQTLTGWRRALTEGADETARAATATRLEEIARRRAQGYFDRLAAQRSVEQLAEIGAAVDVAIRNALRNPVLTSEVAALELFLRSVPRTDEKAWADLFYRLSRFSKLPNKSARLLTKGAGTLDEVAFRAAFRSEASSLKGLAMETWFWRSKAWTSREGVLLSAAQRRARNLGMARGEWKPILINEPLLTIGGGGRRAGLELYDGSIIISRGFKEGEKTVEGFLDLAVQIKAEKDVSAVRQVAKDVRRELELGGLTELRTRDGKTVIRLLQAPDGADPVRLIVAPELPSGSKFTGRAAGVHLVTIPTLLNAEQLDDLAYFMIRAVVTRP